MQRLRPIMFCHNSLQALPSTYPASSAVEHCQTSFDQHLFLSCSARAQLFLSSSSIGQRTCCHVLFRSVNGCYAKNSSCIVFSFLSNEGLKSPEVEAFYFIHLFPLPSLRVSFSFNFFHFSSLFLLLQILCHTLFLNVNLRLLISLAMFAFSLGLALMPFVSAVVHDIQVGAGGKLVYSPEAIVRSKQITKCLCY